MVEPVGGGSAGAEGRLEAAVEAFHEAVGLRVVGGGGVVVDVEGLAEVVPEGGGELRAKVRCDEGGDAVAGDPVADEGVGAVGGVGRGEGDGIWPAGGAVHNGEAVVVAGRGGKGANKVKVNVGEWLRTDRDRLRAEGSVAVDFGGLAEDAGAAPAVDVGSKVRPDVAGGDEAAGGAGTRVGKVVDVLEKREAEGRGDKRAKRGGGSVTMERDSIDGVGGNVEGGGGKEGLSFWAEGLLLGQMGRGKRRDVHGGGNSGQEGNGQRPGEGIGNNVGGTGCVVESGRKLREESKLGLLAARFRRKEPVEGGKEGMVVSKNSEGTAL